MKNLKCSEMVVFICGFIPMFFVLAMLLYLSIARIYLGYWPTYGTDPDPAKFGFFFINLIGFIGFMLLLPSLVMWLVGVIYGVTYYRRNFKLRRISLLSLILSVSVLVIMRLCFDDILTWYFD